MIHLVRGLLIVAIVFASGVSNAAPKYLKKASKNLDKDNPIQMAVYQVLESYPDFEGVLGAAYTQEQQEAWIDDSLAKPDFLNQGRVAVLQTLESMAPTLRHLNIEVEGASGLYYVQESVQPIGSTTMRTVQWTFDVPLAEGPSFARQLFSQIEALLRKDKKWLSAGTEDKAVYPHLGLLSKVYSLKMTGTEQIHINVDYPHTSEAKEALGLRLSISQFVAKLN